MKRKLSSLIAAVFIGIGAFVLHLYRRAGDGY